jgi:hypothetical protein
MLWSSGSLTTGQALADNVQIPILWRVTRLGACTHTFLVPVCYLHVVVLGISVGISVISALCLWQHFWVCWAVMLRYISSGGRAYGTRSSPVWSPVGGGEAVACSSYQFAAMQHLTSYEGTSLLSH